MAISKNVRISARPPPQTGPGPKILFAEFRARAIPGEPRAILEKAGKLEFLEKWSIESSVSDSILRFFGNHDASLVISDGWESRRRRNQGTAGGRKELLDIGLISARNSQGSISA